MLRIWVCHGLSENRLHMASPKSIEIHRNHDFPHSSSFRWPFPGSQFSGTPSTRHDQTLGSCPYSNQVPIGGVYLHLSILAGTWIDSNQQINSVSDWRARPDGEEGTSTSPANSCQNCGLRETLERKTHTLWENLWVPVKVPVGFPLKQSFDSYRWTAGGALPANLDRSCSFFKVLLAFMNTR